jgi:serine/threonine protein kinase
MARVERPNTALNKTEVARPLPLSAQISEGSEVAGRYRILSLIGQGGMGTVYRAEHLLLRKVFALKVLQPHYTHRPEVAARFEREAIAAARIEHRNVVPATDFGRLPDGAFFLVLEFVDGRTLRSELKAGAMRVPRALGIMRGMVAGACAAHENGIIHRDLKPENIMLVERDGNRDFVKLLDFGVARMDSEKRNRGPKLTEVGGMIGTPQYMSPEQFLGGAIDARSDLYSLGVILFELLTGRCPFVGDFASLLEQHVTIAPPELPPTLSSKEPRLAEVVRTLLSKAPDQRIQTAKELAAALDESSLHPCESIPAVPPVQGPNVLAPIVTPSSSLTRSIRRLRVVALSGSRSIRGLGSRVPSAMAKVASSTSSLASRRIKNIRDTVRGMMRRRSDRKVARNRQRRVALTIAAAQQLGRRTMKSGRELAGSARAAWSTTVDYCRIRWRSRSRGLTIAVGCAAALILTVVLVITLRGGLAANHPAASSRVDGNGNGNAGKARPANTAAAGRSTSSPKSSRTSQ